MLSISIEAAKHILAFLAKEKKEQPVRLTVSDTKACGDFSPKFSYGARIDPDEDTTTEVAGLTLVCDLNKLPKPLTSIAVDVRPGTLGTKLILKSPNLEACGCGQSARIVHKS